ncbi:MAG: UDP-N-acetylglucosamine 4,6-dehydratase [Candidatus Woesebacteria bacterium GW2011_GWB1_39_10]|uniref:UDP-N-acetylglucosamine 4,6-dehydratase n=2 Tax=Candidatus Woeseibacteriota TaxID=1752722 RepID=A0A0G0P148_9BACT|nr:MAG: UDP-N-acetylglucosamine 4,6-dehydratase [Candidatus Woesebacteria bacterium GW2011_GWB1_39_10]KKS90814.1 MAG: UDP-N-acetylglucosamine 4,6-dehydratase [Candidatus Woesebacteria bacterium GW2011_GWA1_43_12]
MTKILSGKRILVTGGTGSFGRMFIGEILKYRPKEIIVFSRDEDKQGAMRLEYNNEQSTRFVLGDIRDFRSVREAMRGVDIVVHAAALKWITEVEYNVWEGIKTNVIGAENIIEAARDEGVEKVVALSTDKAVEPINAYGMAKALQERLITTANLYDVGNTVFVSTRYGNVLGSRGSVVPHFKKLIQEGKPLTITDSRMTRFILTLQKSVELVLTAMTEGVGGEVFVRKMPGHSIVDLAEVLLEANGKNTESIVKMGIRPGEKIHETLISPAESVRTVEFGDYYVILPQISIPAVEKKYAGKKTLKEFRYASDTTEQIGKKELRSLLEKEGWV